mmetsp:Transcript_32510/g.83068  ORF Transcript_32510/g.83068 Transcript_32510/m.83068 type:complete len:249 (+) Transcript_32510:305-1051(+)
MVRASVSPRPVWRQPSPSRPGTTLATPRRQPTTPLSSARGTMPTLPSATLWGPFAPSRATGASTASPTRPRGSATSTRAPRQRLLRWARANPGPATPSRTTRLASPTAPTRLPMLLRCASRWSPRRPTSSGPSTSSTTSWCRRLSGEGSWPRTTRRPWPRVPARRLLPRPTLAHTAPRRSPRSTTPLPRAQRLRASTLSTRRLGRATLASFPPPWPRSLPFTPTRAPATTSACACGWTTRSSLTSGPR